MVFMTTMNDTNSEPVYFKSLTVEGINCFKTKQTIEFTNQDNSPALWTVILGNNNSGKTTLLRSLSAFSPDLEAFKLSDEILYPNYGFNPLVKNKIKYASLSAKASCILSNSDYEHSNEDYDHLISQTRISVFLDDIEVQNFKVDAYGTQRKEGKGQFIDYKLENRIESLFKDDVDSVINAEEWFLGTDYNALKGGGKFAQNLIQIKEALISLLPDIKDIEINENGARRVHFITHADDRVLVNQLGSGYQSLITWVVDFAKRMFDRYPESANPLAEPAIVLVDEIDLHLHPEWQRKIVSFLSERFPKTQFIVTAHSPLVIQSASNINVVVLQKDEKNNDVSIFQPETTNFQGWSVEEILSNLMQMGDKIHSETYLKLMQQFDKGLDSDNYQVAKTAYDQLEKIIHSSATLKMLRLQMSSLIPEQNG